MTIGIIAHVGKEGAAQAVRLVVEELTAHNLPFLMEKATAQLIERSSSLDEAALAQQVDLLLVMGGDGSILRAIHRSGGHLRPIFGLNIGSLGFLTCMAAKDYQRAVQCLADKNYLLSKRSLLEVYVEKSHPIIEPIFKFAETDEGQGADGAVASRQFKLPVEVEAFDFSDLSLTSSSSFNFDCCEAACTGATQSFAASVEFQDRFLALNDLVLSRGERSQLVRLSVAIDGNLLTEYHADGLIIATPTGSTAYSLAAGGPIVMPESKALIITPICPHVFSNRSMVLSDQSTITVTAAANQEVFMSIDGREARLIKPGERLIIRASAKNLSLAMLPGTTFAEILRQKLQWTGSNLRSS